MIKANVEEMLPLNKEETMGFGKVNDIAKYQTVKINKKYLKKALEFLDENWKEDSVYVSVKNNEIMQIGKKKVGIIIAPMIDDE